jgi:nitrate reductase NapE component
MNSQNPAYKSNQHKGNEKSSKKRRTQGLIISFLFIIIGISVLCFIIMGIIGKQNEPQNNTGNTIIFHEADFDYDIMKDENYLELDRNVRFENTHNGITIEIVDDNLNDVPTDIRDSFNVINNFIKYAISGDHNKLNELFSDEYIAAEGETKMEFTMQQLYNIKVTYIDDTITESDGYTYSSQDFWLEYMIRKNNGTFRSDMASDCIKKEYVRITNRNDEYEIDVLAPFKTEIPKRQTFERGTILSIAIATVLVVTVVGVCGFFVNKKYN